MTKSGIRGWLLLFVVHVLAMLGTNVFFASRSTYRAALLAKASSTSPVAQGIFGFVAGRAICQAAFCTILAIGIYHTIRRSEITRRYWLFALPLVFGTQAGVATLLWLERLSLIRLGRPQQALFGGPFFRPAFVFVAMAVWWLYWHRSERVRLTYTANIASANAAA